MIPSLIFIFSIGALLQFGVSYCRILLTSSSKVQLSSRFSELSGLSADRFGPSDFDYLLQLIHLAPRLDGDVGEIRLVMLYYRLARMVSKLITPFSKAASQWFDGEFARCAQFAAVALDRRLAVARE